MNKKTRHVKKRGEKKIEIFEKKKKEKIVIPDLDRSIEN